MRKSGQSSSTSTPSRVLMGLLTRRVRTTARGRALQWGAWRLQKEGAVINGNESLTEGRRRKPFPTIFLLDLMEVQHDKTNSHYCHVGYALQRLMGNRRNSIWQ